MTSFDDHPIECENSQPLHAMHLWDIRFVRDLLIIGLIVSAAYACYALRGVLIPIAIGFVAAYAVNPALVRAQRDWKISRITMIVLMDIVLAVATAATLLIIAPRLLSESDRLLEKAPGYIDAATVRLHETFGDKWRERLQQHLSTLPKGSGDMMGAALGGARNTLDILMTAFGNAFYVLTAIALIPFYFNFFAWKFDSIEMHLKQQIPEQHRETVLRIGSRMDTALGQFFRGRVLVVGAMMIMFTIAFWIVGVPYWFLLGVFTGLLSFVPFFAFVGCILAVLVTWVDAITGDAKLSWTAILLWPILAYSVVQLIEGWILTPWIQSQSLQMNAVTVIIVLMIGGAIGGIWGLLLALPAFDCLRILWDELLLPRYKQAIRPSETIVM